MDIINILISISAFILQIRFSVDEVTSKIYLDDIFNG